MKVLVTGGAGFIGSHLVDSLVGDGNEVHVIDNLSNGKMANVNPSATFHRLDIFGDRGKIERLFKKEGFDFVFHLAAMARIPECLDKPIESFNINVTGTLYLLQLAREFGVQGFVFSSSSSVYGEVNQEVPIVEETKLQPISLYGLHKLAAEQLVLMYAKFYGLKASALRYFNVYGTNRQSAEGAYPNVFSAFGRDSQRGEITIFGDGEQRRDYVHVFDVVRANLAFIDHPAWGQVFNVGTGETHTVNEVARYFSPKRTSYQPARIGDPRYSCAEVSRAKQELSFKAETTFEEGARIYLDSLHKNGTR